MGWTDISLIPLGDVIYKGVIDASAGPNYPAARQGDMYAISVQGYMGGVAGTGNRVLVNDLLVAKVDTVAGTAAAVGANWVRNGDRKLPMVTTIVSSATPTVDSDFTDCVTITALATPITNATTNLTGFPVNFQKLEYRILDNGVAQAIAWGAKFTAGVTALPTTTIAGKLLSTLFQYNTVTALWECMATGSKP